MKKYYAHIKGLLLLVLTVSLFSFSSERNARKSVTTTPVKFENAAALFMTENMVNKLLIQNKDSVKKQAKSLLDLHSLEKRLLQHPMVENATVFLTVDGQMQTLVKQRTPILRIQTDAENYYLDRLGKKMSLSKNYSARVPLVTGNVSENDWNDLHTLITTINNDVFLQKQIIGIEKNKQKEFELKTRVGGQTILLGNIKGLATKFKKLKVFYNKALVEGSIENYKDINLKYHNQVICTKK